MSYRRSGRIFVVLAIAVTALVVSRNARAQNENETVGFQANHVFESGTFGENIDVLNGGLNLSVPIGQRYQVNNRLGYGLTLRYNSKVWDTSLSNLDFVDVNDRVQPSAESPLGLGFTLNLGRITQDIHFGSAPFCGAGHTCSLSDYQATWKWTAPDGSQHEFYFYPGGTDPITEPGVSESGGHIDFSSRRTNDLSYYKISGPNDAFCPIGLNATQCFVVSSQDGLVYTLVPRVSCANPPWTNGTEPSSSQYADTKRSNEAFCGWYTALIEDRSVGVALTSSGVQGFYPNYVHITYETRANFEHAIKQVEDSTGRLIHFHNCEWNQETTPLDDAAILEENCVANSRDTEDPDGHYGASRREGVATYAVDLPAFGGSTARYSFQYRYKKVLKADKYISPTLSAEPVLKLVRIDYPEYSRQGVSNKYSLYYGYDDLYEPSACPGLYSTNGDLGQVSCRTYPVLRQVGTADQVTNNPCYSGGFAPRIEYKYAYYEYCSAFLSGKTHSNPYCTSENLYCNPTAGSSLFVPKGQTQQVVTKKSIDSITAPAQSTVYCRDFTLHSNPEVVTVTDTSGNDAVHHFHSSAATNASGGGLDPDDGWAPEWNDGVEDRVEYYEGTGSARHLVRTQLVEYDADSVDTHHFKSNVRSRTETTQYDDDSGQVSTMSRDDWDDAGHWRSEVKSGFDITGVIYGHKEFTTVDGAGRGYFLEGLETVKQVSDGNRVLSRTDSQYDPVTGQLMTSISRKSPAAISSVDTLTAYDGDVETTYSYYPNSGNVHTKTISTGASDPAYNIEYSYAPAGGDCSVGGDCGGYLATKAFLNGGVALWKAIDRVRDTSTGLVSLSRDTAGVGTTYTYDGLGRVTSVTPDGEDPTMIDYVSLMSTAVTQGSGGDFIASVYNYDGRGRKVGQAKRSYDPDHKGYACQTTAYDVESRVTFQSEWFFVGAASACLPDETNQQGTKYRFTDSDGSTVDAFGRVRRTTRFDGSLVSTHYFGNSETITTHGISGPNGIRFASPVTFYRDARNRLVYVHEASGYHCLGSGAECHVNQDCGGTDTCSAVSGGADAQYTYDAADRLIGVDLDLGNGQSQPRRFEYDGLGHVVHADNPENGTVVTDRYDGLGNVLSTTDAAGNGHTFLYDFAGRLTSDRLIRSGGTGFTFAHSNQYDEDLSGSSKCLGKLTTSKTYNEMGQLLLTEKRIYGEVGGRLSELDLTPDWSILGTMKTMFHYDTKGEVTSLSYPSEASPARTILTVDYAYQNGFVVSARNHADQADDLGRVTYNPAGGIETLTTYGGGLSTMTFDAGNRITSITAGKPGSLDYPQYSSGTYEYDGAGNIDAIGANTYHYDASNRIISSATAYEGSQINQVYVYDSVGNLASTTKTIIGQDFTETFTDEYDYTTAGALNRNRIITGQTLNGNLAGNLVPFDYDATGNLIQGGHEIQYPGTPPFQLADWWKYEYSPLDRLSKVYSVEDPINGLGLSERARYTYDPSGLRLSKLEPPKSLKTYYLRDTEGKILSEFRVPLSSAASTFGNSPEWLKDTIYLAGRTLAIRENTRPAPPAGLRLTQSPESFQWRVTLTWKPNSEPDVADYLVYRKVGSTGSFQLADDPVEGGSTSFIDSTLYTAGTTVSYRITCRDSAELESSPTWAVSLVAGDVQPPSIVSLSAGAGDRRVTLSYSASEGGGGYNIYRGTSPAALYQVNFDPIPQTQYIDSGLSNGTTYYYKVQAIDSSGNESAPGCGPLGCPVSATPKDFAPPIPVRGVSACSGEEHPDRISLSWDPNPTSDNVILYRVFRNTTPAITAANLLIEQSAVGFEDGVPPAPPLAPGSYYYMVEAVDAGGNVSSPSIVTVGTTRDPNLAAPTSLSAAGSDGSVSLLWSDAVPKPKYAIYRKLDSSASACYSRVGEMTLANSLTFVDGSVQNNAAYDYVVTSIDSAGHESRFSKRALGIPLERPRELYQCSGRGIYPYYSSATVAQWVPPNTSAYHPILANTLLSNPAYLIGYHLYHYGPKQAEWPYDCATGTCVAYKDISMTRQVFSYSVEPSVLPLDPYLLTSTDLTDQVDPAFPLDSFLETSPPLASGIYATDHLFVTGAVEDQNCILPKAVYKVFVEGTWLTVESGWPAYFDNANDDPFSRCDPAHYLLGVFPPPACTAPGYDPVPAPSNVLAYSN